jgi:hypothetical protein
VDESWGLLEVYRHGVRLIDAITTCDSWVGWVWSQAGC